ncbi:MAG TPA: site-specific integrase, partial [Anaerolineales bacterium]|nr:site-specific integrase [Anaerolineales bacterium]
MKHNNNEISLKHAINQYNRVISESRSQNTARSYSQAITKFIALLTESKIDTDTTTITSCSESWIIDFIDELRNYSPATEQLYLTAVVGFYEFLASEYELELNLPRVRALIRRRQRRVP